MKLSWHLLGLLTVLSLLSTGCKAQSPPAESKPKAASSRLEMEKSPYLQQHADNTVDWYPWGEEALAKAKAENKPIFLSIGYSTCHWCHVMEEESFMDPAIGAYLKKHFVSIKVDRETRPDVDAIYMNYVQRTTGSGGWPLTVFLTPEGIPFYGGTYFPNPEKYGKIGFGELLSRVEELWRTRKQEVLKQSSAFAESLSSNHEDEGVETQIPTDSLFLQALGHWERTFDKERGGFLPPPKFPSPPDLEFLLRYHATRNHEQAGRMVYKTLEGIALGGIHDQLEGGFHRYSVDENWLVPHFEKMLYDQAQLLNLYSKAYALEPKPLYREAVLSTTRYLSERMKSPLGGYYSAEDADSAVPGRESEHAEGAFYVWSYAELREICTKEELTLLESAFGVTENGNAHGQELQGQNVLARSKVESKLPSSLAKKLREARNLRPRPHRDEKVLTEWNAMLSAAFLEAGRYLEEPQFTQEALGILAFLEKQTPEGPKQLRRSYLNGEGEVPAFGIDYATLVKAYLTAFECGAGGQYLEKAIETQEEFDRTFWDSEKGGYFDTRPTTALFYRKKSKFDGATMACNSVAALNLAWLHDITGKKSYSENLEKLLIQNANLMTKVPTGLSGSLAALLDWRGQHRTIIVMSKDPSWQKAALSSPPYKARLLLVRNAAERDQLARYIPFLPEWAEKSAAYLCEDFSCGLPMTDLPQLLERCRTTR